MSRKALVFGAGGFIGGHMVTKLKKEGFYVLAADVKENEFGSLADKFLLGDLGNQDFVSEVFEYSREPFDEIYQFAADMGGAGYIFTGLNDANVMTNSALINLNILKEITNKWRENELSNTRIFYSSSACIYPEENQIDNKNPNCREDSAYPANPDSEYGWEKLFSERLYKAYGRNHKLKIRIARYHNIYGPLGTWRGGKEKAPAAICRKVAEAPNNGTIDIWGDGEQTRSFLYIDECIEATLKLMRSDYSEPVNIGSEEMVSINELVQITSKIANKNILTNHLPGPLGVRGRNSNNELIRKILGWDSKISLHEGILKTYEWISTQIKSLKIS
jgi:nucleoside-diphosphate-sugar epimerase